MTWDGLKLFSPVFLFIGLNVFLSGYFTALGNGFISALISSMRSLILVAVFILILPKLIGVAGVWMTMPLAEAVTIFIAVYLYRTYGKSFMQEIPEPCLNDILQNSNEKEAVKYDLFFRYGFIMSGEYL